MARAAPSDPTDNILLGLEYDFHQARLGCHLTLGEVLSRAEPTAYVVAPTPMAGFTPIKEMGKLRPGQVRCFLTTTARRCRDTDETLIPHRHKPGCGQIGAFTFHTHIQNGVVASLLCLGLRVPQIRDLQFSNKEHPG